MVALGRGRAQFEANSLKIRGQFQLPTESMKRRGRFQLRAVSMKMSWNRIQKELKRRGNRKCRLSLLSNSATVDEASMEDSFVKDFSVQGVANEEFFVEEASVTEFSGDDASIGGFSTEYLFDQETALAEATDKSTSKKCTGRRKIFISSYSDLEKEIQSARRVPLKVTLRRTIPLLEAEVIMKKVKKMEKMKKRKLFDVVNKKFFYYTVHELKRARGKLDDLEKQLKHINNFGGREVGKSINALQSEVESLRLLTGKDKPNVEKQSVAKGSPRKDSAKKHIGQDNAVNYALKHSFGKNSDKDIAEMASTKKLSHQQEGTVFVSSYSDLKREIKFAVGGPLNVTLKKTLPLVDAEIIQRKMKNGQLYRVRVVNHKFLGPLIGKLRRDRKRLKVLKAELKLLLKSGGTESQGEITDLQATVKELELLTKRKK